MHCGVCIANIYVCMYTHIHPYIYTHIHPHIHTCSYAARLARATRCVRNLTHTYIHTCMHAYPHIHAHVHIYSYAARLAKATRCVRTRALEKRIFIRRIMHVWAYRTFVEPHLDHSEYVCIYVCMCVCECMHVNIY